MPSTTDDFLIDLNQRRGLKEIGHNSIWDLELYGGTIIEPTAFEPDPLTHQNDYYYNAVDNVLYRKVITIKNTITTAKWHKVSE